MNGPNILIARDGRIRRIISGRGCMAPCREALSSHFRSRPAGEFAERVAVGAEDGQDALLVEELLAY